MPIVYEGFGNVLTHKAQTVTCPVNTVAVMGAGLALAMRNRIRGLNDYYKGVCHTGKLTLGKCLTYDIPGKHGKQVLLFPTKGHWKDDSSLEDIEESLKYLAENYKELNITELAMIPLGCGLGKLDYGEQVRPLIVKYLEPLDIDIYLLHREAT